MVDTNIVIHLARLERSQLPQRLLISAITLAELSAGPHQTADPVERVQRITLLQRTEAAFQPLPFDTEAARHYGALVAAIVAVDRKPRRREADLMIASVAVAHGLPLFTTNPDDFRGLAGIVNLVAVERPEARDGHAH
ncbi:type II toxin-antitoxin system VapC family toxin [Spiractinospora alimapuensis]|uniref:type II toxin-antitoxin system VapC family toxin n=1 Tax=Spiractinospora alimapuensis TaxID=2820884 RepID=UPI001F28AB8D|nr:type II toxin-antitoxin system VapC family toxin [Spiractinospora alimapuensis]